MSKNNGTKNGTEQAALATQVVVPTKPPADSFDPVRALVIQLGERRYVEGMRRAVRLVSLAVGRLAPEDKAKFVPLFDDLEKEVLQQEKVLESHTLKL